ncbi:Type II/IV secretion system protein [Puniceibacterium sp. IMCC21224]|nr:Type II/IV secretion system protein [Puniceibacterium sp. IMCC21224]
MSQDTEDLAARLAALEATGDKKRGAARASPLAAILGVAGIVAVGGLAWAALQPSPEAPLPTAAPEEFQTTGSGFGDLAPMPVVESAPPPAETGPSASELALMESLATLRAELEDLRARPVEASDSGAEQAIADLTAQIAALQEASTEAQRALERQLTERDRELDQLRMDLEVARLRMRPDRIVLGEVRGREAITFLEAINTGHGGSLTTLHAETPQLAVRRLAIAALKTDVPMTYADMVDYIEGSIDVVIQAGRHDGARGITEFFLPGQARHPDQNTGPAGGAERPTVAAK